MTFDPSAPEVLRDRAVTGVTKAREVSGAGATTALAEAYDLSYKYFAPFITNVVAKMLVDLSGGDGGQPHRVLFLGRDGHSLAVAARRLAPDYFKSHCAEVVLSRIAVEAAIQDLEHHGSGDYSAIAKYRGKRSRVGIAMARGAFERLDHYLTSAGVPVGSGGKVTLIDMSFKGSVQEMLAAIYPELKFNGAYVALGEAVEDPHPGSKKGYAVHLRAKDMPKGEPLNWLPDDQRLTFAHQDAIAVLEDLLRGSRGSAEVIGEDGPQQREGRLDWVLSERLQPNRIHGQYISPKVREAVRSIMLVAIHDFSGGMARATSSLDEVVTSTAKSSTAFRTTVHSWIAGHAVEPPLERLLNSFVSRLDDAQDKNWVASLEETVRSVPRQRPGDGTPVSTLPVYDYPDHQL